MKRRVVIEYNVVGEDGTIYPPCVVPGRDYYSDEEWEDLYNGKASPEADFEGLHRIRETGQDVPVTYDRIMLETEKSDEELTAEFSGRVTVEGGENDG